MCDCANCDGITLFEGTDGNGIVNTTYNSTSGVLTLYYTDGTSFSTTSMINYALSAYITNPLGSGTSGTFPTNTILPSMTYTVPTGGAGTYEVLFVANSEFSFASTANYTVAINVFKNGTAVSTGTSKSVKMSGVSGQTFSIPVTVLATSITAVVGDIITIQSNSTGPTFGYLTSGVLKINKIA